MWKNIVQPDRPQVTIWRIRIACYTYTHRICNTYWFFHCNNGSNNVPLFHFIRTQAVLCRIARRFV